MHFHMHDMGTSFKILRIGKTEPNLPLMKTLMLERDTLSQGNVPTCLIS